MREMEKTKDYRYVRFTADVIQDALALWINMVSGKDVQTWNRFTETDNEKWTFDSDEEFFAAYRRPSTNALLNKGISGGAGFAFSFQNWWSRVAVKLDDRSKIERIFDIFEKNVDVSRIPVASEAALAPPTIFIGHGRSGQWRELKDHLTDKHNYRVNAYEVGARAGHVIRDILQDLLIESSFALLVLTAEDETSTGEMRARQNVVHELGLFQGKLGFPRAIAVVEEGVELMSNLDGIQQLCFSSGNISEVYGDVIATIRREFGDLR
jgi:predicted nucleotide-binding protein